MKSCYKLLSILMILILITGCSSISYAVEDSKTEPQIKLENNTLYTYGVPILIKRIKQEIQMFTAMTAVKSY